VIKEKLYNIMPYGVIQHMKEKKRIIPSFEEPKIYNADGRRMKVFYLQDDICYFNPYSMAPGRFPKYILWDRNNFGLKNHFYTHRNILKTRGKPEHRYALMLESVSIMPKDYELFSKKNDIGKDYDFVFTHSQKLLNELENARWIPGGHVWYGGKNFGGVVSKDLYLRKTKNISMVSSDKVLCDLHKLRINTVKKLENLRLVDGYGTYPGNRSGDTVISKTLQEYRYSIVFENNIEDYYFTEKILNCFEAMTVPIYLGAKKIKDFFNIDGIIQLDLTDIDRLEDIIRNLGQQDYGERRDAILENFERVQKYLCLEDYIYNSYLCDK
jgi:hypothetical protein